MKVVELLKERFDEWQQKGYIPSDMIEEGYNTNQVIRERGWAYWHQLFNPRQLLLHGLLMELIDREAKTREEKIVGLLGVNRCCNRNSKLCQWINDDTHINAQTFYNQALNTFYNYGCRPLNNLQEFYIIPLSRRYVKNKNIEIKLGNASDTNYKCHIWITDPPYADAVNYHELSEFFLAWDRKFLKEVFPDWYTDSKRALAIKGSDKETFKETFLPAMKNIVSHMHENGYFILMFTHQDSEVFADLTEILLESGLMSVNAWSIVTETEDSISEGNFVQSTVSVVLKRIDKSNLEPVFIEELYPVGKEEVERQINLMYELDSSQQEPIYSPTDLELSGYYAALRVLTSCNLKATNQKIKEFLDAMREYASSFVVPDGLKSLGYDKDFVYDIWRKMDAYEKFYIRGIEFETRGERRIGVFQDAARSLGIADYDELFAERKPNNARLKTATELGQEMVVTKHGFSSTTLRMCLLAINNAVKKTEEITDVAEAVEAAHEMLKTKLETKYWNEKSKIELIFRYLSRLEKINTMQHWKLDSQIASYLAERISSDRI
ncbi:hypothetical protein CaldiYA01_09300 [Caldicellulosiruptor diazotrophicus]|uniref:DUF1156 domain-containing protein n=2 Tax=Caldicellulosiruptor diazotrophicus TaxID=2806205 RepID=A0ABN6E6F8_9FIRM|nr:hypothetical protein CaldiYA01_09300 [Caldicellulosiruptor diazotrophicus]